MRQALAAVDANRRDEWDRLGWALFWLINSKPNFSKRRRRLIPLHAFNPFASRVSKNQSEKDATFAACWELARDAN